MKGFRVEVSHAPSAADERFVATALLENNAPFLGPADHRRLGVFVRSPEAELLGGLVGITARGWLFIDLLWIAPSMRRLGIGSQLLTTAEREAVNRGCRGAWLDTYDFQARPFYEAHGYRLFGELEGFPNGHRRYFLQKTLPGPSNQPATAPP
jgi:GNAT superfamily N-acetyltransferase